MNRSTINYSDKSKQGQTPDSTSKNQEGKQRYVDPGSMTINDTHVSFVRPEELQRLDARESLEVPLTSFYGNGEIVDENGVAMEPPPVPGITQPLGPPSMPNPDRVSELPESERERRYMIEKTHKQPAGPHVVIDTPIPSGTPLVDTLSPEIQRNRSLHDNSESVAELEPIAAKEAPPHQATAETILKVVGLEKSYRKASIVIPVLRGVNLKVKNGQFVSIVGQSGSGKSTLLHLLGTLDSPDTGEIYFHDRRIDNLPSHRRDVLRNNNFGMIFQFYHLLPELNVLENVLSPLLIREGLVGYLLRRRSYRRRAIELIEAVGLGHRLKHKPRELSGGEMQRTAIARALISQPELLLADEPTGNLDQETGAEIIEILRRLNREQNLTILMVTHDRDLAETADQTIGLVDGRIV